MDFLKYLRLDLKFSQFHVFATMGSKLHFSWPLPSPSFPAPNVASGSFVTDADLGLGHDWQPSREELMVFSAQVNYNRTLSTQPNFVLLVP